MPEHTHRYHGTGLSRADGTVIEPGQRFTPTDAELRAFGDLFEPLADAGEGVSTPDEPADANGDDEPRTDRRVLLDNGLDPDDYRQLQSAAGDTDDVAGNQGHDALIDGLAEHFR